MGIDEIISDAFSFFRGHGGGPLVHGVDLSFEQDSTQLLVACISCSKNGERFAISKLIPFEEIIRNPQSLVKSVIGLMIKELESNVENMANMNPDLGTVYQSHRVEFPCISEQFSPCKPSILIKNKEVF